MALSRQNKYVEELKKEQELLTNKNPFKKTKTHETSPKPKEKIITKETPHYKEKVKSSGYFNLILDSDYQDLELEIRGLRYVKRTDEKGKEKVYLEKKEDHYLSDDGAEDILLELKAHLNTDIKLGFLTVDEFLQTQDIIRKSFIKYMRNNMHRLGMDDESKQRKARTLIVMILMRIRSAYSRSVRGVENKRSHGDINLSGQLDNEKEDKFKIDQIKN
jgi:hypothetical protein